MDAEVERERRRVLGTPVTLETFLAWRAKFEAEMAAQKKPTFEDEVAGKPSGMVVVVVSSLCAAL
jgi:hypothetical protein